LSGVSLTLHGLRGTVRTMMCRLGVARDIAEPAIGHQRADLVARYNKDQAWPERCRVRKSFRAHQPAVGPGDRRLWQRRIRPILRREIAFGFGKNRLQLAPEHDDVRTALRS
jgi:hypothetical protein